MTLSDKRFTLNNFLIYKKIEELPSKQMNSYVQTFMKTIFSQDSVQFRKKLRPDLDNFLWNIDNRINLFARNSYKKDPSEFGIDEKNFNTEIVKSFDSEFLYTVSLFNSIIVLDSVKEYKIKECVPLNSFTFFEKGTIRFDYDVTYTTVISIELSVTFSDETTKDYTFITSVMQGKDKYYTGFYENIYLGETVINETENEQAITTETKNEEVVPSKPKNTILYFGKDNEGYQVKCPEQKSKISMLRIAYMDDKFVDVIDYAKTILECPYGLKYKDLIRVQIYNGDAYMRLYADSINQRNTKYRSNPNHLLEAIDSYITAYKLIDDVDFPNYSRKYQRFDDQHYNAVIMAYNHGVELSGNNQVDS